MKIKYSSTNCIRRDTMMNVSVMLLLLLSSTSTSATATTTSSGSSAKITENSWLDIVIQDACFVGLSFPNIREQHGDVQVFVGESGSNSMKLALCMAKLYYFYDMHTGLMEASENYIRHNGTFISQNDNNPECENLGFAGPRTEEVTIRDRQMRVDEYIYCCKSIVTTVHNRKPTVCNTPQEIRIAIRNANAKNRK